MGKKWGSNEDIHIGGIFCCYADSWPEYYQVTALRGRTQVILHAVRSEIYINEGIAESSSLYWRRERTWPLTGQLLRTRPWPLYFGSAESPSGLLKRR